MKKMSKFTVAAIASLAVVSSGVFAWFVTSKNSDAVTVSAGTVGVKYSKLVTTDDVDNKLPGEKIVLNSGNSAIENTIQNDGTRGAIVELNIDAQSKAVIPGNTVPAGFENDYELVNGEVVMKPDRLKAVIGIDMADFEDQGWMKIGDKYYVSLEGDDAVQLGTIEMTITGELGGNKKQSDGTLSKDRPFEQGTRFSVGYGTTGVQRTFDAVSEIYDDNVANALKNAGALEG